MKTETIEEVFKIADIRIQSIITQEVMGIIIREEEIITTTTQDLTTEGEKKTKMRETGETSMIHRINCLRRIAGFQTCQLTIDKIHLVLVHRMRCYLQAILTKRGKSSFGLMLMKKK